MRFKLVTIVATLIFIPMSCVANEISGGQNLNVSNDTIVVAGFSDASDGCPVGAMKHREQALIENRCRCIQGSLTKVNNYNSGNTGGNTFTGTGYASDSNAWYQNYRCQ